MYIKFIEKVLSVSLFKKSLKVFKYYKMKEWINSVDIEQVQEPHE